MQSNQKIKKVNRFFTILSILFFTFSAEIYSQVLPYSMNNLSPVGNGLNLNNTLQNPTKPNVKPRELSNNGTGKPIKDSLTISGKNYISEVNPKDTLQKYIFGKSIFTNKNLYFEPNLKIATPSNYIVGPDDELIVDIYGYSEDHYTLSVNAEGTVKIPKIGNVHVGGLTIQEVKRKIVSKLSKIFLGLKSEGSGASATNLYASITLGNIRQINVLVQGEVENPGIYTVPSLAKAMNLLYLAGGPTTQGTFRKIELIRNNKVIGTIDLYDYLLGGILKNDFTLEDRDILKVGLYQNRINIIGKIKRPMLYEFVENETLEKAINLFGGGFSEDAYTANVKITRFTNKERKVLDVNTELSGSFLLKAGDQISIEGITENRYENRLNIFGEVWRPGYYSLENCPTLLSLISKAGGFKENAFTSRILIKRLKNDNTFENLAVNYNDLLSKKSEDINLKREDEIFVSGIDNLKENFTVTIHGEINTKIESKNKSDKTSKSISSKLQTASEKIEENKFEENNKNGENNLDTENEINSNLISEESNNKLLERQNKLTIPFINNMTVEDLILKAGGLRESANLGIVEIVRRNKSFTEDNLIQNKIGEIFKFSINKDLNLDQNASKFKLEPFDEVFIRSSSTYQIQQFVTVKGEIKYPGVYGLEIKDEKISSLITRAGNPTLIANLEGASLLRKRKKSDFERSLREDQLNNLNNSSSQIKSNDKNNSNEFEKIGIDLNNLLKNPGGVDDLTVEDGDVIDIPILKQTVKISGEVIHPTTVAYKSNFNFKDYINHSGGFTQKSARKRGYVIYANGNIDRARSFLIFKSYPKIKPGSEIIIPTMTKNAQQVASMVNIYTGTITSLISLYLLVQATTK